MNKGYAFGFLLILLVMALGFYVAYSGFMSSRDALKEQQAAAPTEVSDEAQAPRVPTRLPSATATGSTSAIPTPIVGITLTLTSAAPVEQVQPAATDAPPAGEPTDEPSPTAPLPVETGRTPTMAPAPPTPVPIPAYQFRLAAPPAPNPEEAGCCYIRGTVRDAAGNGLEGIQVYVFNEWSQLPFTPTKGGVDLGQYNIPVGHEAITWYMYLVDSAGTQISTQTSIAFDPAVANGYRVDWQSTY
jgi:hypothetical protein